MIQHRVGMGSFKECDVANGASFVCGQCVGDGFLRKRIDSECEIGFCSFCEAIQPCLSVGTLADEVANVLDKFYGTGPVIRAVSSLELDQYVHAGYPLDFTVAELLVCGDEQPLTATLVELLTARKDENGELCFEADALYMRRSIRPTEVEEKWQEFKSGVMHRSRFFNHHGKAFLDWLFQGIHQLQDENGFEVVSLMEVEERWKLFRGRYCPPSSDPKRILMAPDTELAAPPKEKARAGRMNPVGVPVFYGAFDRETCIAELRPSIGSMVLTGEFQLLRDVRVFDFAVLENIFDAQPMSCFDPDYQTNMERRQFLRTLHSKISTAVTPDQEHEYLYTQVIAEYLSTQVEPPIDGVMFSSVQNRYGMNIVLFSSVLAETPHQERDDDPVHSKGPLQSGVMYVPGTLQAHKVGGVTFEVEPLVIVNGDTIARDGRYEQDPFEEWDY